MMNQSITKFILDYVENYGAIHQTETRWRTPLVGFAAADDPLFPALKDIIVPSHALP